jgi:hypothetical protein
VSSTLIVLIGLIVLIVLIVLTVLIVLIVLIVAAVMKLGVMPGVFHTAYSGRTFGRH